MKYKIEFQYKPTDRARPFDEVQEERIQFDAGEFVPIPAVGDTIEATLDGHRAFKVLTRHFAYLSDWCAVTIVVTDVSDEEMGTRLKM